MIRPRTATVALVPVALHALAREADRGLGLVLRAEVEPAGLAGEVARAVAADGSGALARVAVWLAGGLAAWLLLATLRRLTARDAWSAALAAEASVFLPLLLRPALTLLALLSVAGRATYPYGFTLPVALTQDWSLGQDLAAAAAILALRLPLPRVPAPRAGEVFLLAFLGYASLVPDWALQWEGHPGNEPKYLRQSVAIGQFLTFDAEGVSAGMEDLAVRPLTTTVPAAARGFGRESWAMTLALARGRVGRDDIRATRITRQTVRGKEGGVYYVLAPGPSILLAPALRLDRAINIARGERGRVAVSVLLWCALAALLVAALFRLVRDLTGQPPLASALALGFAVVPPFLFYSFQFYPEMVGALVLAVAFRALALRPGRVARHPWLYGWLLATLPWLHQKFLPVWLVLVAASLWIGLSSRGAAPSEDDEGSAAATTPRRQGSAERPAGLRVRPAARASVRLMRLLSLRVARPSLGKGRRAVGLLVPTLVSLYLTALYNFAITGSVRPDALFLAWGPAGVTTARVGQGVLGLLLDARYGILPYVPVLMLAAAGLAGAGARRLAVVLPAAGVYYLTVASADNWAGAVCNLGRYFMPIAPLAVALVGIAVARATDAGTAGASREQVPRGFLALVLMLAAWTAVLALALWRDPHAANDSALLLAKSTYADGHLYIPDLFIRRWGEAAPGLWTRIAAWLVVLAALAGWARRVSSRRGRIGSSPTGTLAAVAALVLAASFVLERWPGRREAPSFGNALAVPGPRVTAGPDAAPAAIVFIEGAARTRYDEVVLGPGEVALLLRSTTALRSLTATVGGQGSVRIEGLRPMVLRPTGALVAVPFAPYHVVRGRDGRSVAFARARLAVHGEAVLRLGEVPAGGMDASPAPEDEREPVGSPDR